MDPTHEFEFSFPLNFPSQPSSPFPSFSIDFTFNGFPQPQLDFPSEGNAESDQFPQPPESLHGTLIPPFLSKTFDLVEDPSLNSIISWGEKGESFVVWEPAFLATNVLPRCFKHDNFSSFVRQLNTYGFRKIDQNKWEFANEFFLRGSKHLLKNIQRRKSPNLQQFASEGTGPGPGPMIETEVEKLRTQKSAIMQEMAEIQQQQREAAKYMETIKQKLVEAEKRQKKMLSFLVKMVRNPEFIEGVMGMEERSRRSQRKIVKPKRQERVTSSEAQSYMPVQTEVMNDAELAGRGYSNPDNEVFSSLEFGLSVDFPETVSMSGPMDDSWSSPESYNFAGNGAFFSGGHLDAWELSHLINN